MTTTTPQWTKRHNEVALFALRQYMFTARSMADRADQKGPTAYVAKFIADVGTAAECCVMLSNRPIDDTYLNPPCPALRNPFWDEGSQSFRDQLGRPISPLVEADNRRATAEAEIEMAKFEARKTTFQARVQPWMQECFGPTISADREERNHRFLEEALELVQSCGCSASEAHQLVDYTFNRPVGEPTQEVGGVMVTLAALCLANKLDMHAAGETELARISTPEVMSKIRAKQAAKPRCSPLPAVAQPSVTDEVLRWAVERWCVEVKNRPLRNVHRRTLDDTWRQVVCHLGGDDVALLGKCHDDLLMQAIVPSTTGHKPPFDLKAADFPPLPECCEAGPRCGDPLCDHKPVGGQASSPPYRDIPEDGYRHRAAIKAQQDVDKVDVENNYRLGPATPEDQTIYDSITANYHKKALPLTDDEIRAAVKAARNASGPSDATQPSEYVLYGAKAAIAKAARPKPSIPVEDGIAWQSTGTGVERTAVMVAGRHWYRDDDPKVAAQPTPPAGAQAQHPDDIAVDRFAAAMKAKLAKKRDENYGGWDNKDACTAEWLSGLLRKSVEKGDPLDVGNFSMMLHQRGERISLGNVVSVAQQDADKVDAQPEWIDDPHDIEQGMMRNPKYKAQLDPSMASGESMEGGFRPEFDAWFEKRGVWPRLTYEEIFKAGWQSSIKRVQPASGDIAERYRYALQRIALWGNGLTEADIWARNWKGCAAEALYGGFFEAIDAARKQVSASGGSK